MASVHPLPYSSNALHCLSPLPLQLNYPKLIHYEQTGLRRERLRRHRNYWGWAWIGNGGTCAYQL
jgi:hypothetical protein